MPIYLTAIDYTAMILYTLYFGGVLGGAWVFWRTSGKQRFWGLLLLLEGAAAAVVLTLMSSKYWFSGSEGVVSIAIVPLVSAILQVSLPLLLGILLIAAIGFATRVLVRRGKSSLGLLLPCLFIPLVFGISVPQLVKLTEQSKPVEQETHQEIVLAPGFRITPFMEEPAHNPTSIAFGPDNHLYVANYNGDIWGISMQDRSSWKYATGFRVPVGLAWHEGSLYVASHGKVSVVHDNNGDNVGELVKDIVSDLPARLYPWHANNGIVFDKDGRIYFAVGSTSDRSEETHKYAATILSANADGSDLQTYATGVRNPYRLAFNSQGDLFATDNGPDGLDATPGDELNRIVEGGDYGFPREFGIPSPGSSVQTPIALFPPHSSADGLVFYQGDQFPEDYYDNAFVTLWHLGQIYRVQLTKDAAGNYSTRLTLFATGLSGPLDMAVGPDGNLYVIDFNTNIIYKIEYVGGN